MSMLIKGADLDGSWVLTFVWSGLGCDVGKRGFQHSCHHLVIVELLLLGTLFCLGDGHCRV